MAITEDLSIYFDTSTGMAVAASYTPKVYAHPSSQSVTLNGIFNNEYIEVDGVATKRPDFMFATDDLTDTPKNGDQITILSVDYYVRDIDDDGTGVTTFILEKK